MKKREREEGPEEFEADVDAGLSPSQRAAKKLRRAEDARMHMQMSSSSSSSSSASAVAFVPVMGYCCVNPLLGQCVQREVKDSRLLRATGGQLGCSLTKGDCEKSCLMQGELLKKIATGVGYGQKELPNLSTAMITTETQTSYAKNIKELEAQAAYLHDLMAKAEVDAKSYDYKNSITAYKEITFRLGQDMGKRVPGLGLWIANAIFFRMQKLGAASPDVVELLSFMIPVINTLFRRGYIDRFSEAFQKLLWSNVLEAIQAWVFMADRPDGASSATPGLLALLDLAAIEPKAGAIWTRDSLAQYLGTLNLSKIWSPFAILDYAYQYYIGDEVFTIILGAVHRHLPKYMLEAVYRWILDKTYWFIDKIPRLVLQRDWKIPALDNLIESPYVGDVRDPWWQNALRLRFNDVKTQDDFALKLIGELIKLPWKSENPWEGTDEEIDRRGIVYEFSRGGRPVSSAQKYQWLYLLMIGQDLVPNDNDPLESFAVVKRPIHKLPDLTHLQMLELLRRLRCAKVLETGIDRMNKILAEQPPAAIASAPQLRIWPEPFNYPTPGTQFAVGTRTITAPISSTTQTFFPTIPHTFPTISSSALYQPTSSSSSSSSSLTQPAQPSTALAAMPITPTAKINISNTALSGGTRHPSLHRSRHGMLYGRRQALPIRFILPPPPMYFRQMVTHFQTPQCNPHYM